MGNKKKWAPGLAGHGDAQTWRHLNAEADKRASWALEQATKRARKAKVSRDIDRAEQWATAQLQRLRSAATQYISTHDHAFQHTYTHFCDGSRNMTRDAL